MGKYSKYKNLFDIDAESELPQEYSHVSVEESSLTILNEQQKRMVLDIDRYLSGELKLDYFTIQGIGGSGKSFTIKKAIAHIHPSKIIVAAPSHAAKNVLKNFLGPSYNVMTVAKLLGKIIGINSEGEQVLKPNPRIKAAPIKGASIIIIDEVSMIPDNIAKSILKHTKYKKLILMGDYGQLPPVGQTKDSLFFDSISAYLTTPMRFTGHIFNLTSVIRQEIDNLRKDSLVNVNIINEFSNRISKLDYDGSGYVFFKHTHKMLAFALELFKKKKGTDYVRIIAYKNKTIDMINDTIRLGLYGLNPSRFMKGEIVISDGGFSARSIGADGKVHSKPIISNGEVLTVDSITETVGLLDIPVYSISFKGRKFSEPVLTLAPEGEERYMEELERLIKKAKKHNASWEDVKTFKDSFAVFKYAYAISSHKAQGATIKHVFVFEEDILNIKPISIKEKLQSLYVSLSRASYKLYILNTKYKTDQGEITSELLKMDK